MTRDGRVPRTWLPADTRVLLVLTLTAGFLRLIGLGVPGELISDELYYAPDACWYAHRSAPLCTHRSEVSVMHPPLAKWMIAAGIGLFGYTPFGWRVAAWAMGTSSIALLYLLARRLSVSTMGAAIAAGLLAVDFLHFVHSRVAMLDVFLTTCGLAAFLFAVYDRDSDARGLWRPWRLAAGAAAGAAIASKWPGVYLLAGVIILTLWWESGRSGERDRGRTIRAALPSVLLAFAVVPAIVYIASYAGVIEGRVFALPWEHGSWARAFAGRQWFMLRFHAGQFLQNPWQSPAWSWLLLRRPVLYYLSESDQGLREILALGNPLVWWPAILAVGAAAAQWIRRRGDVETVILVGVGATYLPWLVVDRVRTFVFLFYVLPTVPFLCLAVARVAAAGLAHAWGRVVFACFAAGVLGLFVFFHPLLTARPMSYTAWRARVGPFSACGPPGTTGGQIMKGTRLLPAARPGPPPSGWCWI